MVCNLRMGHKTVHASNYKYLDVPYFEQKDSFWCGPACLSMVSRFYARNVSQGEVADYAFRNGMSRTRDLARFARAVLGLDAKVQRNSTTATLRSLVDAGLPPIVLQQVQLGSELGHFRVVTSVGEHEVTTCDPMFGYDLCYSTEEFSALWQANKQTQDSGVLLSMTPRSR